MGHRFCQLHLPPSARALPGISSLAGIEAPTNKNLVNADTYTCTFLWHQPFFLSSRLRDSLTHFWVLLLSNTPLNEYMIFVRFLNKNEIKNYDSHNKSTLNLLAGSDWCIDSSRHFFQLITINFYQEITPLRVGLPVSTSVGLYV